MNTYLASGLIGSGIESSAEYTKNAWATLTDGNIPEKIQDDVTSFIETSISENSGLIPTELYSGTAFKLAPYVSGLNQEGIEFALRTNDLFGLAVPPTPPEISELTEYGLDNTSAYRNEFTKINNNISFETSKVNSSEGFSPGIASKVGRLNSLPKLTDTTQVTASKTPPLALPVKSDEVYYNQNITSKGTFVSSVEELEADMVGIIRPISEIIVHWSETYSNANLTGSEIEELTGSGTNAYHYIIKRDGSIERGVPLEDKGVHCPEHNNYSIGVCLVGGVNVSSGDLEINENYSASGITRTQYNTLHEIFRVFFIQYPGGQALGHSEIDASQEDPGFEVRDYVFNCFNKRSLYQDPLNDEEMSPSDLITKVNDQGTSIGIKDPDVMDKKF